MEGILLQNFTVNHFSVKERVSRFFGCAKRVYDRVEYAGSLLPDLIQVICIARIDLLLGGAISHSFVCMSLVFVILCKKYFTLQMMRAFYLEHKQFKEEFKKEKEVYVELNEKIRLLLKEEIPIHKRLEIFLKGVCAIVYDVARGCGEVTDCLQQTKVTELLDRAIFMLKEGIKMLFYEIFGIKLSAYPDIILLTAFYIMFCASFQPLNIVFLIMIFLIYDLSERILRYQSVVNKINASMQENLTGERELFALTQERFFIASDEPGPAPESAPLH